jgi:peptidoglycan/LPS O-acetylase OafA/YrhL
MPAVQQIKPLTSIRGFAAFWVVSMHLNAVFCSLCPALKHLQWLTGPGGYGVDLFFVLSGFILCYSHLARDAGMSLRTYFQFIWLRIARVYPAYVTAMAAVVAFVLTARYFGLPTTESHYPSGVLLPELLMVHTWTGKSNLGWNAVDWSVSAEWFAYLFIFPVANLLLARIKSAWMYLMVTALLLAGLGFSWPWGNVDWAPASLPVILITLEFLAGAMLYGLRRQWSLPPMKAINSMLGVAIGTLLFLVAWPGLAGNAHRPMLVGCFGLAILALSYQGGMLSGFLSKRIPVYFGEISYSLYLTHQIVQRVLKALLHPDRFDGLSAPTRLLFFAIYLVAIIGAAMALFHLVEQPGRRYLRKISPFERK